MEKSLIGAITACVVILVCVPIAFFVGAARGNHHRTPFQMGMSKYPGNGRKFAVIEAALPYKYSAPFLTPRYYQEDRGTCWDFATIGVLEQSYRMNGVRKGFMKPEEYVRFNEQAYGLSVIDACRNHPDVCDVVGDFVYHNSTEGGEVWWLYNLKSLYNKLLPSSVCPYTDPEHEHDCPNMPAALASNPIKFNIKEMYTAYNAIETKALLLRTNHSLAWSSEMHNTVYYFPCAEEYWSTRDECKEDARVRCPTDRNYNSEYCARVLSSMFDMDGEFYMHGQTLGEGGHAMNVVGYNDQFTTKQGQQGGFIIRNSWHDQLYGDNPNGRGARGSHSVAYFMQEISAWDERAICPGPLNPDNWISCVEQEAGPHMRLRRNTRKPAKRNADGDYDITDTCLSESFMQNLLDVSLQPTEFQCTDENMCSKSKDVRYFLISLERNTEQDLAKVCMLQYNTTDKKQATICTPFHIPGQIAYWFTPIDSQLKKLKDDEDLCGYWFWPYEMLSKQVGLYVNFYSTYFDIDWEDSSYLANKKKFPSYDYSYLEKSTLTQKKMDFYGPSPFPKGRY